MDLRIDKSYYLKKLTTKFYIDIQNFYNFQAEQQDIIVRAEDANGQFILTDNGTKYGYGMYFANGSNYSNIHVENCTYQYL